MGQVAVIDGPWVNPRHGRGPWDQVTAHAKRGTISRTWRRPFEILWTCKRMFRKVFPVTSQRAIGDKQEGKGKGNGTAGSTYSPGRMGVSNTRRRNRTNRPPTPRRRSRIWRRPFGIPWTCTITFKLIDYRKFVPVTTQRSIKD